MEKSNWVQDAQQKGRRDAVREIFDASMTDAAQWDCILKNPDQFGVHIDDAEVKVFFADAEPKDDDGEYIEWSDEYTTGQMLHRIYDALGLRYRDI